jgi:peptidoglycan/LPS O-acetylase OafA/YrhL
MHGSPSILRFPAGCTPPANGLVGWRSVGTFRFILAMAVLMSHIAVRIGPSVISRSSTHILIWAGNAVFAFFIISGFYMSLIVNEKYAKLHHGTRRFYVNRALRLYPIHWTILILYATCFLYYGAPNFLMGDLRVPLWLWLYAVCSNVSFFGVEVLPFFNDQNWAFVVGPIWSLSIECYFYLLAPFIVGRSLRALLVLLAAAGALRLGLYVSGAPMLPWRYLFFPADLVLFLLGALSYRLYDFVKGKQYANWLGAGAAVVLIVCVTTPYLWAESNHWGVSDLDNPAAWCFYICVCICTPLLFNLSAGWKFDNLLGQLSYPVYLSHVLVIEFVLQSQLVPYDMGLVATELTLALSLALYLLIDRPIERIRQRIKIGVDLAPKVGPRTGPVR